MKKIVSTLIVFSFVLVTANAQSNGVSFDFAVGVGSYNIPPRAIDVEFYSEDLSDLPAALASDAEAGLAELNEKAASSPLSSSFIVATELGVTPHLSSVVRLAITSVSDSLSTSGEMTDESGTVESYEVVMGPQFRVMDFALKYYFATDHFGPFAGVGVSSFATDLSVETTQVRANGGSSGSESSVSGIVGGYHTGIVGHISVGSRFRMFKEEKNSRGLTGQIFANYYPTEELGSLGVALGYGQ